MQLLIVQLSDIHFKHTANPVSSRVSMIIDAIQSIIPTPQACLLLVTGDISWSGEEAEYTSASEFFTDLYSRLSQIFGAESCHVEFIPGNHDCRLPKDEVSLRQTIVEGAEKQIDKVQPDAGILTNLLSSLDNFYAFHLRQTKNGIEGNDKIYRSHVVKLAGKSIKINSYNTALFSQRDEKPGSLSVPLALIEDIAEQESSADLTISIYHHPESWLSQASKRGFRKLVESSSHLIFTGHEHQQDCHWNESDTCEHVAYIEADALQDRNFPRKSGFNCLVLDFELATQTYFHFIWKKDMYSALIDAQTHPMYLDEKVHERFTNTPRWTSFLEIDDFGFTRSDNAKPRLADVFIYTPLSIDPRDASPQKTIKGVDVLPYLLTQTCAYIRGQDRCGKTSLFKTLYSDILKSTVRVPVYIFGGDLKSDDDKSYFDHIWSSIRQQYGNDALERYKQLPASRRVLFIDDLQKCNLNNDVKRRLILASKKHFGLVIVASNRLPDLSDYGPTSSPSGSELFSSTCFIRELAPSVRSEIIDKWIRLRKPATLDETLHVREVKKEHDFLTGLIRKKALPSLPYLVLGVLQIRQSNTDDAIDPGSIGFMFQKLVLDALSAGSNPKKYMARKDGILKRFAFSMFKQKMDTGSVEGFHAAVKSFAEDIKVTVDGNSILEELLAARVLTSVDNNLSFTHPYFYHYFIARQLLDDIDSDSPDEARQYLNDMVDRPLTQTNQLTLIFFLFFKRRDPVIDRLITHANTTFGEQPMSDIVNDVKFIDKGLHVLEQAKIDENVDVSAEKKKRDEADDRREEEAEKPATHYIESTYSDSLETAAKAHFATAQMELLGQVIRSFPDYLEGDKKVEILECVFKLGLRSLHAMLITLANFASSWSEKIKEIEDVEQREKVQQFVNNVIVLLVRYYCNHVLINISRAVGASDIEDAYEEAATNAGDTCATKLINLAIRLDHSEGFPLPLVQKIYTEVSKESRVAAAILSDLVQRHTQIFPLQKDTLRKIAGVLHVDATKLIEASGSTKK